MLDLPHLKYMARRLLPRDETLSEVIPLAREPVPVVVFFYFRKTPGSPILSHPRGLLSLDPTTGERIGETVFRADEWETAAQEARVPRVSALRMSDPTSFLRLRHDFEHALSSLMPKFFRGLKPPGDARDCDDAVLLLDRWEDATEQGFLEHYRAVGSEWFAWLESLR